MNNQGYRFARLLWLYGEIVGKGPISFERVSEDWARSTLNRTGEPLPHKTFENHRKDVEDLLGIVIDCDRATNTYFLSPRMEPDFSRATMDMLNGALIFNRVQSNPAMRRFIRPEHTGEDSSMLFEATDALAEGRALRLRYRHNYDRGREADYEVKPLAVKQFRQRWYVVAEMADGRPYSFPLDRIVRLERGEKVEPSTLDVDALFADSFGIIREEAVGVEEIRLKVEHEQANYFLSLPLHGSQRVVEEGDDYVTFALRLCPTYDFIMEVMSHGPKVEVLAPQSLRTLIANKVNEMSKIYNL